MWTTIDDMRALQNLVLTGRLDFTSMVAEVHAPRDCHQVYHRLATEKTFPLIQFDWSKL
jgi:hypothetical protein